MQRFFAPPIACCAMFFNLAVPGSIAEESQTPSADLANETLSAAIQSRQLIESARISLSRSVELDTNPQYEYRSDVQTIQALVSSGHRRFDVSLHLISNDGEEGRSDWQAIFEPDGGFIYRPARNDTAVEVSHKDRGNFAFVEDYDWDLRCLGMMPVAFHKLDEYRLGDVFRYLEMGQLRATRTDEMVIINSTFVSVDGVDVNCEWHFRPNQGHSVVYAAVQRPDFAYLTEVDNKQYSSGFWYPSSLTHRHIRAGDECYRERIDVHEVDVGVVISDDTFSLAAMDIESGRSVSHHGKAMVWNGTQLVKPPELVGSSAFPSGVDSDGSGWNVFYVVNGVLLMLAGVSLLKWSRKKSVKS